MRFMIIVKATAHSEAGKMPSPELLGAMGKFNEEMIEAGVMEAGEGLHPSSRGVRLKFDGDKREVAAGPFLEDEVSSLMCGFWIINVASLDEAVAWMKRCPSPHDGPCELEIRQIFATEDFGDALTPELRAQEERLRAKTEARAAG